MNTVKFSQKYTIVQLLEDIPVGTIFDSESWPLHVTIVDVFAIKWTEKDLIKHISELAAFAKPFSAMAEDDEYFGNEGQTQVTLINKSQPLNYLHLKLLRALEPGGLVLNDPQFANEDFRPHATVQQHMHLEHGDKVVFNELTIIDMFPGKDAFKRKIVASISLD